MHEKLKLSIIIAITSCAQAELNRDQGTMFTGTQSLETKGEILHLCGQSSPKTLTKNIYYSPRADCNFASSEGANDSVTAGNLHALDGFIQAREVQSEVIKLPVGAIMCGLDIKSPSSQGFKYDDMFAFTLNDHVLLLSSIGLLNCDDGGACLDTNSEAIPIWNFDKIKGKKNKFDTSNYCFGMDQGSTCIFPEHDRVGEVDFSLSPESSAALALNLKDTSTFTFRAISTGDNDRGDCEHTGITLDVNIQYIERN